MHVAAFLGAMLPGGAERVTCRVLEHFGSQGHQATLVLAVPPEGDALHPPDQVSLVDLGAKRTLMAIPKLTMFLRRRRPDILLATVDHAVVVAVISGILSRSSALIVARASNSLESSVDRSVKNSILRFLSRAAYRKADLIVAPSKQLCDDLRAYLGVDEDRVVYLANPVVDPAFQTRCALPIEHPFFNEDGVPTVVAAGRFHEQKDFKKLIQAFATVSRSVPARLLILGDGQLRPHLEELVEDLALGHIVDMPGHVNDVAPYFARSDLFVLSSIREGSPGVLIEALAAGLPVVACDCPTGPAEILSEGRFGTLVSCYDEASLAKAILTSLESPQLPPTESWQPFTHDRAFDAYLSLFTHLSNSGAK